jgi:hypothetical protein
MGGNHSTSFVPPPPNIDPLFEDIGCIGLKTDDYSGRLSEEEWANLKIYSQTDGTLPNDFSPPGGCLFGRAPFLWYRITAKTYTELHSKIIATFKTMHYSASPSSQNQSQTIEGFGNYHHNLHNYILQKKKSAMAVTGTTTGNVTRTAITTGNGEIYGPVYFLVAQDAVDNSFEGFLYFPTMNKSGGRYKSYNELSISHRWINTLLYSPSFARQPSNTSKCGHYNSNDPLKYGCKINTLSPSASSSSASCKASADELRSQKVYKDATADSSEVTYEKDYYPAVYFHTYKINTHHASVAQYMNSKGFANLQLNSMSSDMNFYAGCDYMLVSPNNQFIYILNQRTVTLIHNLNLQNLSETCFKTPAFTSKFQILKKIPFTGIGSKLIIEGTNLNVYSYDEGGIEDIAFSIPIVDPNSKAQPPFTLILDNMGRFNIYDAKNTVVTSVLLNKTLSASGTGGPTPGMSPSSYMSEKDIGQCVSAGPYNDKDSQRCRMLNLVAYLKLKGVYKNIINTETDSTANRQYQIMYEKVATFDSKQDYVKRLIDLVNYIEVKYKIVVDKHMIDSYMADSTHDYSNAPATSEYNIMQDVPLYDALGLKNMASTLPLASQLNASPSANTGSGYNADKDKQNRYMELASNYSEY